MRETDPFISIVATLAALLVVGPSLLASKITDWLIDHRVLAPASADPIVVVPHTSGAGLDGRRLVALAAVLVALIAVGVLARIRTRGREEKR